MSGEAILRQLFAASRLLVTNTEQPLGPYEQAFCFVLMFVRYCRASPRKEVQHGQESSDQGVPLLRGERVRLDTC